MSIKVRVLVTSGIKPTQAHKTDAGFDLYAPEDITLEPDSITKISLGVSIVPPVGYHGQIVGRSGLAFNHNVTVFHVGTIDAEYTGDIGLMLRNEKKATCVTMYNGSYVNFITHYIKKGERIAQIVFHKVPDIELVQVDSLLIDNDSRGNNGFGSSGR